MIDQSIALLNDSSVLNFISGARVARLATADQAGQPHNVPLCYWFDGARIYFVIDEKPKRRTGTQIKRMRNIAENPRVALVIDCYEEDWAHLAYVLIRGHARVVDDQNEYMLALRNLRDKYSQYRGMALAPEKNLIVKIDPEHVHAWGQRFNLAQDHLAQEKFAKDK